MFRCRCCGCFTLDEPDSFEICPVCFWEDDPIVTKSSEGRTGANGVPLVVARENYARIGVCEPRFEARVRPPTLTELGEPDEDKDAER